MHLLSWLVNGVLRRLKGLQMICKTRDIRNELLALLISVLAPLAALQQERAVHVRQQMLESFEDVRLHGAEEQVLNSGGTVLDELVVRGASTVNAALLDRQRRGGCWVRNTEDIFVTLALGLESKDQMVVTTAAEHFEDFIVALGALLESSVNGRVTAEEKILEASDDVAESAVL